MDQEKEEKKKQLEEELRYYKSRLDRLKEAQAQIIQEFLKKQKQNSISEE